MSGVDPVFDGPDPRARSVADFVPSDAVLDRLPVAVYVACAGVGGQWLYVSPRIEELFGFRPEEFTSDPYLWSRIIHPADRERMIQAEVDIQTTLRAADDYRIIRSDGQIVWIFDDAVAEEVESYGQVEHGLLHDITDRKRSELMVAAQAEVIERVLRDDTLTVVLTDIAAKVDDISAAGHCVIEVHRSGAAPRSLVVGREGADSFGGPRSVAHARSMGEPRHTAPIATTEADYRGMIAMHYPDDVVPQVRDAALLEWAAQLAAMAFSSAAEHDRTTASLAILGATLEATGDGILVADSAGRIVGHNRKFLQMWDLDADAIADTDMLALARLISSRVVAPEDFLRRMLTLMESPAETGTEEIEFLDGRVLERFTQAQDIGERGIGRVWSFRDVTSHHKLEEELRSQAHNDSLTPLANRTLFMQRLSAALAKDVHNTSSMAVLLLDLDDFKTVNDGLGHVAGDKLLIAVAERLRGCLRFNDTAARLGGDEFVLLLEDLSDPVEASYAAERILAAVSRPLLVEGQVLTVRASIGIAVPEDGDDAADLLRNADLAMYTAKREGGASTRRYRPGMHVDALARLELKADLERAIASEQLVVHYQPIVLLESRTIVGVEALVRWEHPTRGFIGPADFIPLAEETGLIERLGRWVLRQACAQTAHWRTSIPGQENLTVSVNLSPRQLSNVNFPDDVRRTLWASGLPAAGLVLEITESSLAEPGVDAPLALRELKEIGIGLALDDFGTGYSSLGQLVHYPLDVVKVDKSFVDRMDEPEANSALISAVLHIADALSLSVTVEGIETERQLSRLTAMGARRGQGYLLSRAADVEATTRMLELGSLRPQAVVIPGDFPAVSDES